MLAVCFCFFFKRDIDTLLLFLLLLQFVCLNLGQRLLVFCALFVLRPSLLLLLRDGMDTFLALRVSGLLLLLFLLVFALSLVDLFVASSCSLFPCTPKHAHPCPWVPCFSPPALPPVPIHPSAYITPNTHPPKMTVMPRLS